MWRQRKTNYCKCTHCMLCLIIMCNVAALTFYATIYEDICCICNKCREKHVLGTASTAGSLCLFDLWVLWLPGQAVLEVTIYNHGLIKKKKKKLTLSVLYASVVLVHQSRSSFIVLNVFLWLCFTWARKSMNWLFTLVKMLHWMNISMFHLMCPIIKRQGLKKVMYMCNLQNAASFTEWWMNFMYRCLLPKYYFHKWLFKKKRNYSMRVTKQ